MAQRAFRRPARADSERWLGALTGNWALALGDTTTAMAIPIDVARAEALIEASQLHCYYGSTVESRAYLESARSLIDLAPYLRGDWLIAATHLALRQLSHEEAREHLTALEPVPISSTPGRRLEVLCLRAHTNLVGGDSATADLQAAMALARKQRSSFFEK